MDDFQLRRVCMRRDAQRRLDLRNGVVFGRTAVMLVAGAAMHGQRSDAGSFGNPCDTQAVAVFRIPAGA